MNVGIRRLRDADILRGVHAEVDPKALGIEALLMIELSKHRRSTVDHFLDEIVVVPQVRFAVHVTGRHDLIVHVVVRDTQHLKDIALDNFTHRPGVERIETSIVFDARRRYAPPLLRSVA